MLSSTEIEKRLGELTVSSVQTIVSAGFDAIGRSENPEEGMEAMRCLLLQLLAAAVIMPVDGAKDRAEELANDLVELVSVAAAER